MILIFDKGMAVFRNGHIHIFTHDAAEIRGHKKSFQSWQPFGKQLCIYELHKINEISHSTQDMSRSKSVGQRAGRIEKRRVDRQRDTSLFFL